MTAQHPPEVPADGKPYARAYAYKLVYTDEDEDQMDEQFLAQRGWHRTANTQHWVGPAQGKRVPIGTPSLPVRGFVDMQVVQTDRKRKRATPDLPQRKAPPRPSHPASPLSPASTLAQQAEALSQQGQSAPPIVETQPIAPASRPVPARRTRRLVTDPPLEEVRYHTPPPADPVAMEELPSPMRRPPSPPPRQEAPPRQDAPPRHDPPAAQQDSTDDDEDDDDMTGKVDRQYDTLVLPYQFQPSAASTPSSLHEAVASLSQSPGQRPMARLPIFRDAAAPPATVKRSPGSPKRRHRIIEDGTENITDYYKVLARQKAKEEANASQRQGSPQLDVTPHTERLAVRKASPLSSPNLLHDQFDDDSSSSEEEAASQSPFTPRRPVFPSYSPPKSPFSPRQPPEHVTQPPPAADKEEAVATLQEARAALCPPNANATMTPGAIFGYSAQDLDAIERQRQPLAQKEERGKAPLGSPSDLSGEEADAWMASVGQHTPAHRTSSVGSSPLTAHPMGVKQTVSQRPAMTPISEASHDYHSDMTKSSYGRPSMTGRSLHSVGEHDYDDEEEAYDDPTAPVLPTIATQPHNEAPVQAALPEKEDQSMPKAVATPRVTLGTSITWMHDAWIADYLGQERPSVLFEWDGYTDLLSEKKAPLVKDLSNMVSEEQMDEGILVVVGAETYEIRRKIGEGGYAIVYLAQEEKDEDGEGGLGDATQIVQQDAHRICALKVQIPATPWECYMLRLLHERLPSHATDQFASVQRFYHFGDCSALIMPYKSQGTLLGCVNLYAQHNYFMPETVGAYFTLQIIETLQHLYDAGMVHTDLKADNFMLRIEDAEDGLPWSNAYPADVATVSQTAWREKGLHLIDFGRSIDLTALPSGRHTLVSADWEPDETEHPLIVDRSGQIPAHAIDAFGAAGCVYVMLYGQYMTVQEHPEGPDPISLKARYVLTQPLRGYWKASVWQTVFDGLLNPPRDHEQYRQSLDTMQSLLQGWLQKEEGLKALIKRLEIMLLEKGLQ